MLGELFFLPTPAAPPPQCRRAFPPHAWRALLPPHAVSYSSPCRQTSSPHMPASSSFPRRRSSSSCKLFLPTPTALSHAGELFLLRRRTSSFPWRRALPPVPAELLLPMLPSFSPAHASELFLSTPEWRALSPQHQPSSSFPHAGGLPPPRQRQQHDAMDGVIRTGDGRNFEETECRRMKQFACSVACSESVAN